MPSIIENVLRPSIVTKIVSRIRTPGNVLSRHWGWNIGGANVETLPYVIRQYTYDIFDNVRTIARPRQPYTPAGTIAANPVGNNTVTVMRVAEKLPMDYNRIAQIRTIGENAGQIDRMGKRYVEMQGQQLRRRHDNFREWLAGTLFRGGMGYIHQPFGGDDMRFSYTASGALYAVDFKFDTQHKLIGSTYADGLAMNTGGNLISGTWATASNDIPRMLMRISAGFQRGVGEPLKRIYCGQNVWLNVLQNDKVRQLAGTSSSPFAANELTEDKAPDGTLTGLYKGAIKGLPWLDWFIYDGGLEVFDGSSETYSPLIPDGYCLFTVAGDDHTKLIEGGEIVKDNDLAEAKPVYGFYSWILEKADPARFEMHTLQNATLEVSVPKCWAVARVQNDA